VTLQRLRQSAESTRATARWLLAYAAQTPWRHAPAGGDPVHVLLCIADHYEPHNVGVSDAAAMERVDYWVREYPRQLGTLSDSDGRPPQHTFFYPLEQYRAAEVDGLSELCHQGFGEVEVHLHHDHETAASLHERLLTYKQLLVDRHRLLSRSRDTGEIMYGFVHGNWALSNSRPDGRWCGVENELTVLHQTGCYADFTLPSAPSPTQTRKINSIYYARPNPAVLRPHDVGVNVGAGERPDGSLMLIQGPLVFNWGRRKWGVLPRVENGCIQPSQPMTMERVNRWLRAHVQVAVRPDWFFVKLHTHGAHEAGRQPLLGRPAVEFHQALADRARADANFHYHYVTAREMYNLARAAEAGWQGSVDAARDFELALCRAAGLDSWSMRSRRHVMGATHDVGGPDWAPREASVGS
jgi:hypothetical protein